MHFDTGLLWVDVEDDFNRARRRQMLARFAGWLRGQPGHVRRILLLDEVVAALCLVVTAIASGDTCGGQPCTLTPVCCG